MKTPAIIAASAASLLFLSACTSATSTTTSEPASQPTVAESELQQPLGGTPDTWAPQDVQPGANSVVLGQYVMLAGLPDLAPNTALIADTSDENIMWLSQVGPDTYLMAHARGIGSATVTVTAIDASSPDRKPVGPPVATYDFTVKPWVDDSYDDTAMPGSDPATWAPVEITSDTKTVELAAGQFAIIDTSPIPYDDSILITSSDPAIVAVEQEGPENYGVVQAQFPGTATLTITDTDGVGDFMEVAVTVSVPDGM